MFTTFVPTCILMFSMLDSICEVAGYDKDSMFKKYMLLGIYIGVMGTLINCCANMAFLTYSGSVFASLILGREEINQKFIWSKGLITLAVFMIVTIVVGIGLSYIL